MRIGERYGVGTCAALALFAGGAVLGVSKLNAASAPQAGSRIDMVCTVSGPAKGRGELTTEAICARFSARIHEALGLPVALTKQVPAGDRARWVRLEIKLRPRGRAEAVLTSRLHGKATNHPQLAVQVMDKPLGLGEIDRLARLAGKTLAGD